MNLPFRSAIRITAVLSLAVFFASCPWRSSIDGVAHCYLTWLDDPTTTMTVNLHTEVPGGPSRVYYDTVSRGGDPQAYAYLATGASHRIPGLELINNADRAVHVVELTGLTPGQTYYFIAGNDEVGYTEEKMFTTIPDDGTLRFVVGGDMGTGINVDDVLAQAAAQDPMLAIIGGDVAYANGQLKNWGEWEKWLDLYESHMVTPGGCIIPMILAIGNHESITGFGATGPPGIVAPFYFGYFAQDGFGFAMQRKSYFARDLGPSAKLIILDTGHVTLPNGPQLDWLENELASTPEDVYTFAAYHVPLYPSHRSFGPLSESVLVRPFWLPVFDSYGLTAGFEHHDHMHKRTIPLRGNAPHPEGTVYFGDGCFGKGPRDGEQAQALDTPEELDRLGLTADYLAAWSPTIHFWLVEIEETEGPIDFTAIDLDGNAFDTYTISP